MPDILPDQTPRWQRVEAIFRSLLNAYGYREIRLPIVEKSELFSRSIGEVTDIVEKEMYTFNDRNGDSLTLRPEGTAGCLRGCLQHGLLHNQVHRLWYMGPMFRHERPQKGRYRQFYQLGVECFGMAGPDIDAELILLTYRLWRALGINDKLVLQLNSLGTTAERLSYRTVLVDYFRTHFDQLDSDSQRRLESNPLRILDSKNPQLSALIEAAPLLSDHLGEESRNHFQTLTSLLDSAAVPYTINPRLVRGLDYYGKTVFEWVTDALGAQGTVCAGGRYDALVEQLGGKSATAVGFALGMERLIELTQVDQDELPEAAADLYITRYGAAAEPVAMLLAEQLRDAFPDRSIVLHCGGGSFKNQFKRADKSGAEFALIIGDDEVAEEMVCIKPLRSSDSQVSIKQSELNEFFRQHLSAKEDNCGC